jgi:hypothetical protein
VVSASLYTCSFGLTEQSVLVHTVQTVSSCHGSVYFKPAYAGVLGFVGCEWLLCLVMFQGINYAPSLAL